jgi:DNA-binding XRE family transcriptional regulator
MPRRKNGVVARLARKTTGEGRILGFSIEFSCARELNLEAMWQVRRLADSFFRIPRVKSPSCTFYFDNGRPSLSMKTCDISLTDYMGLALLKQLEDHYTGDLPDDLVELRPCKLPEPKTIGERIRYCRQSLRMTQAQLSKRIGFTRTLLVRYELGETCPSFSQVVRIAKALGVPPEAIDGDRSIVPKRWRSVVGRQW